MFYLNEIINNANLTTLEGIQLIIGTLIVGIILIAIIMKFIGIEENKEKKRNIENNSVESNDSSKK